MIFKQIQKILAGQLYCIDDTYWPFPFSILWACKGLCIRLLCHFSNFLVIIRIFQHAKVLQLLALGLHISHFHCHVKGLSVLNLFQNSPIKRLHYSIFYSMVVQEMKFCKLKDSQKCNNYQKNAIHPPSLSLFCALFREGWQ